MKAKILPAALAVLAVTAFAVRADSSVAFRPGVESSNITTDSGDYECSPANAARWGFSNGYAKADAVVSPLLHLGFGPEIDDSKKAWLGFTDVFGGASGQVPYGSTIKSATLRVVLAHANRDAETKVEFHRILNDGNAWFAGEAKTTWRYKDKAQEEKWQGAGSSDVEYLSQASSEDGSIGVFAASAPAGTVLDIDVTKTVAAWVAKAGGQDANLGWSIWLGSEGANLVLGSPSHPKADHRPTLLVQFAAPAAQQPVGSP